MTSHDQPPEDLEPVALQPSISSLRDHFSKLPSKSEDIPLLNLDELMFAVKPSREDLARAAVLIPILATSESDPEVLLTLRRQDLPTHAGQVSFPGGKQEPDDPTLLATAVREAHEEVGIDPDEVDILGEIRPYQTGSGFHIAPVVAIINHPREYVADPNEVDAIFTAPLAHLMNPENYELHSVEYKGQMRTFYQVWYQDWRIWGATAGILMGLYEELMQTH